MREPSPTPFPYAVGGWIHRLRSDDAQPRPVRKPAPKPSAAAPRADAAHLDFVYTKLLRACGLSLSVTRRAGLRARGLSAEAIDALPCVDTPTPEQADVIASALSANGLAGVPGFYRDRGHWRMVKCAPGFFCAYRDAQGRIVGLQYRLDEPFDGRKYIWLSSRGYNCGTSSGTPLHLAGRQYLADSPDLLITEGSLKADCISLLARCAVLAGGGVTCFGQDFGERFKTQFPDKRAVVCFDADWTRKKEVRAALKRLREQLREAGVPFIVRTWPAEFKGLDDYLLSLCRPVEMEAAA